MYKNSLKLIDNIAIVWINDKAYRFDDFMNNGSLNFKFIITDLFEGFAGKMVEIKEI